MPPKTQNYNYAFLFYDVNERRVQKYLKFAKNTCHISNIQCFVETLPLQN